MTETTDVCVIGAGPAGLTAGMFTARAGLETRILNTGESILRRNAHLENFPGFPAGVNSRLFLDMLTDQAERNGCELQTAEVTRVRSADEPNSLLIETDDETSVTVYVICASWAESDYLDVGVDRREQGSKTYIDVDSDGYTGVPGVYAAGRLAGEPHQTVVSAGHGAKVGLAVIHDSDVPFYNDWVAPESYFTGRGREVPPGCEEIDEQERKRREHESLETMQAYFSESHPDEPTQHPRVQQS